LLYAFQPADCRGLAEPRAEAEFVRVGGTGHLASSCDLIEDNATRFSRRTIPGFCRSRNDESEGGGTPKFWDAPRSRPVPAPRNAGGVSRSSVGWAPRAGCAQS
jgi:hypothetical protein